MFATEKYRYPLLVLAPFLSATAILANAILLGLMVTSNFNLATFTCVVYASVSSLCFASHVALSSNAHLVLKMKAHDKPKLLRSSMALGGFLWVICNAIAFANMLQGDHLNGILYLLTSTAMLYIFLKMFSSTLHQLSYSDYEAEQVLIAQKRLQEVYEIYQGLTKPTVEDENILAEGMNPKNLAHVHRVKAYFSLKVVSLRTSQKQPAKEDDFPPLELL